MKAKSTTVQRGRAAEDIAAKYLVANGHVVIERNLRLGHHEIDLITDDDGILCFVEVRSRQGHRYGRPESTVDRNKQRHLIRAAARYLQRFGGAPPRCRFDVVALSGEGASRRLRHYEDAFRAPTQPRRGGDPWQVG